MKNLKTTLVVLFVSLFVNTISAQKAYINQKTLRTNSNTSVKITFDVDQLANATQVETMRAKLAGLSGVKKVVASPAVTAGRTSFEMAFPTTFKPQNFQDALLAAGINQVLVNNKDLVKTSELVNHFKK